MKQFKHGGSGKEGNPEKTGEMMEEGLYWEIMEESIHHSIDQDEQQKYLTAKLVGHNLQDIIGFMLRTEKLLYDAYTAELWCAGLIMNGYCSDDGFYYFRCWLIAQGKEIYNNALQDPDSLVEKLDPKKVFYDFESFSYVPSYAFRAKTGLEIHSYMADDFPYHGSKHPPIQFNWSSEDPDSMRRICPKLYEKKMRMMQQRILDKENPQRRSKKT